MGMCFHASHGSLSVGKPPGGLPPDSLVENEGTILKDTQRVIERYHESSHVSMLRIVVVPCSPFSVSRKEAVRCTGTQLQRLDACSSGGERQRYPL